MLTQQTIKEAALAAGVHPGDILLVHSSYKSLGPVEGGAETVIAGLQDALGPEGTLVFPTFAQKDFANSYKTWHMDKPSETGYLTEYFRTRPGSIRSDQATHSVAAAGLKAQWLTQTHGHTHKRFGSMGDTPFSADSPWEKMYQENGKIMMLGVTPLYTTFRHYTEYLYIEKALKKLEGTEAHDRLKDKLMCMEHGGAWPHMCNTWICEQLAKQGKVKTSRCGNAVMTCYNARDFVDLTMHYLDTREQNALWDHIDTWIPLWNQWLAEYDAAIAEMK